MASEPPAGERPVEHAQQRHAGQVGDAATGQLHAGEVRAEAHVDRQVAQLLEAGEPPVGGVLGQGDDGLVDRLGAGEGDQVVERAQHPAARDPVWDPAAPLVEDSQDDDARVVAPHVANEMIGLWSGADQGHAGREPAGALASADGYGDRPVEHDERGEGADPPPPEEAERQLGGAARRDGQEDEQRLHGTPGRGHADRLRADRAEIARAVDVSGGEQIERDQGGAGDGEPEQRRRFLGVCR